jgi:hypothetical protein
MCSLDLSNRDEARVLGPASAFQIEGRSLRFGPQDDEVAVYRDGTWTCQGGSFRVLECEVPTVVRFEDESVWRPSIHGPFAAVQISGGTIRHGADFQKVLARFDEETATWIVGSEGEAYSTVVLAHPPRPLRRARPQTPALRVLPQPENGGSSPIALCRVPGNLAHSSMGELPRCAV